MAIDALQPMYQDSQFTTESLVRGIDFTNILTPNGDSLSGTPTVTASVLYGTDTSPQNILNGNPVISSSKTQVLQRISGGVGGTTYLLTMTCSTAQGNTLTAQVFFEIKSTI